MREGHLPIWYTAIIPTREILGATLGRYEQAVNKPLELGGGEAGCPVRKDILFDCVILLYYFIYLFSIFPDRVSLWNCPGCPGTFFVVQWTAYRELPVVNYYFN